MKKIIFLAVCVFTFPLIFALSSCKDNQSKINAYNIDISFDGTNIEGKEKVTFYNDTENAFKLLKFNLFTNAYREGAKYSPIAEGNKNQCYYNGINYGETQIKNVSSLGKKLNFEITGVDKNILSVYLENEVFPDESVSVDIEFFVKLPKVISRTGINEQTVNLGNFYPVLCGIEKGEFYECVYYSTGDPFFSNVADYSVKIKIPVEYNVASSGKITYSKENESTKTLKYSVKNARSFCLVLSKEFESVTDKSLGIEINYYFFDDKNPKKSLDTAVKAIKTFSSLFGEYPYQTYSVVQTPFNEGGMEYTALAFISSDLEEDAFNEVIIHETAHEWWQVAVGNNEIEYGFLDESLAEYSVVLFYENNPEYNIKRKDLIKSAEETYRVYCSVFDSLYGKVNTKMIRSLDEFESEYEYVNVSYIKGCLMHEYLRKTIGDERYFAGLKKYYSEYLFGIATPYDLVGVYERIGADTNGFFKSFFDGSVVL